MPWPAFMFEYVIDTTRAAMNLVFSGGLAHYPPISASFSLMAAERCPMWRGGSRSRRSSTPGCRKCRARRSSFATFWYDNALARDAETFGTLSRVTEAERIVFGSDWRFCNERVLAEEVAAFTAPGFLSEPQMAAISRGNALAL